MRKPIFMVFQSVFLNLKQKNKLSSRANAQKLKFINQSCIGTAFYGW
jgi:hypothetical protein